MKKFIIYNYQGQTAGSFIIRILQEMGIPCIDEFFNKDMIYPGRHFSSVFRSGEHLKGIRPGSIKEAFNILQKSEPVNDKYLGMKICGWQFKKCSDFEENLRDENIIKVFLYRQDEIKLYLTRFFFNKTRLKCTKGFLAMDYNPHPFKFYQKLKLISKGITTEVESEDFFDFRVNTATQFCHLLDLDDFEVKNLCVKQIHGCSVKPLKNILTREELSEMEKFFHQKYSLEMLANLNVRDCRHVCQNLGFL